MVKQEVYIEESQQSGMEKHDAYIDLSKYESLESLNGEIKKLQQDIDIRRRARQRLGINDDDETILIIDEKLKILVAESEKVQLARNRLGKIVIPIFLSLFFLPAAIMLPVLWIIPVVIVLLIVLRKIVPRSKS